MKDFLLGVGSVARTGAYDFGGIVVFYALMWTAGIKAAIGGTLVFVLFDIWRRRRQRVGFPRLYVLTTGLAIIFGVIDLIAKTPFMLKYEGAVSTFVVGVTFALGARGTSIIEELVVQKSGAAALDFPHAHRFFQLLTATWAIYYLCLSVFYAWVGVTFPYKRAILIRQVASFVGLGLMMLVSVNGRALHGVFRAFRLIPREERA